MAVLPGLGGLGSVSTDSRRTGNIIRVAKKRRKTLALDIAVVMVWSSFTSFENDVCCSVGFPESNAKFIGP